MAGCKKGMISMQIECFCWVDVDPLMGPQTLLSSEVLTLYYEHSVGELAQVVEPTLMRHVRQMQQLAQHVLSSGYDATLSHDRPGLDALLTEIVALGTWFNWPLPLRKTSPPETPQPLPLSGLLGTDNRGDGAALWAIDGQIYLARVRDVSGQADMTQHWAQNS